MHSASVLLQSKLIIHGGVDENHSVLSELWALDLETFSWTSIPYEPQVARQKHTMAEYKSYFFLAYGCNENNIEVDTLIAISKNRSIELEPPVRRNEEARASLSKNIRMVRNTMRFSGIQGRTSPLKRKSILNFQEPSQLNRIEEKKECEKKEYLGQEVQVQISSQNVYSRYQEYLSRKEKRQAYTSRDKLVNQGKVRNYESVKLPLIQKHESNAQKYQLRVRSISEQGLPKVHTKQSRSQSITSKETSNVHEQVHAPYRYPEELHSEGQAAVPGQHQEENALREPHDPGEREEEAILQEGRAQ